jgi:hypothetical protein
MPEENLAEQPLVDETARSTDIPVTPLDQLRAEFAEQASVPRLFKRLPARSRRIVAEYKPIPRDDAKKAVEEDSDPALLTSALVRLLIHDPDNELVKNAPDSDEAAKLGLVPLGAWAGKPDLDPLRFDNRFANLLGIAGGAPRQIALAMFEGNDMALGAQGAELGQWSVDTLDKTAQDFTVG